MPRASYPSAHDFILGRQSHSPENENFDFCRKCVRHIVRKDGTGKNAEFRGLLQVTDFVPDEWFNVGDEHPSYDDGEYFCYACDRQLTAANN